MTDLSNYILNFNSTIKESLNKLNLAKSKAIYIEDNEKRIVGSLSDGDIRRWIINDGKLDVSVYNICNRDFTFIGMGYETDEVKRIMIEKKIETIPILDSQLKIVDILSWNNVFNEKYQKEAKKIIANPIVIMAGGKGTRMEPFTKILPKPLIPINDKSIIEIIIDKYLEYGVEGFIISINHKAKIIKLFFEELNPRYKVEFLEEKIPLGTAGCLKLLEGRFKESIIITNCDIIINADYNELLEFHKMGGYKLTLVSSLLHHKVPYGVCEIKNGGRLKSLNEKPEMSFLVSTGMYIIEPEIIKNIPKDCKYDITDIINDLLQSKDAVGVYPISENSWVDTGGWEEYKKAINSINNLLG